MVRTGFWQASRRQNQSTEDKYLLIYLLTGPQRSCIGIYPLHLGEAAAQTGWEKQQLETVLARLQRQKEIVMSGYWVVILNWWDHNSRPGTGFDEKISRLLEEAPAVLKYKWLSTAKSAKVYPKDWVGPTTNDIVLGKPSRTKSQPLTVRTPKLMVANRAEGTTRGSTGSSTPPPTSPPTLASRGGQYNNNNNNNNFNIKSKDKKNHNHNSVDPQVADMDSFSNATSVSCCGGIFDVHFKATTQDHSIVVNARRCFLLVCEDKSLSEEDASQLCKELLARLRSSDSNPKLRIHHIEKWLEAVVDTSRTSGQQILRAGLHLKSEIELNFERKKVDETRSTIELSKANEAKLREQVVRKFLENANEIDLTRISNLAIGLMPETARLRAEVKIRNEVRERRIPVGLGSSYVKQAVEELGRVEVGREKMRSTTASTLCVSYSNKKSDSLPRSMVDK